MTETLPTIRNTIAPASMNWGAGTPTDSMTGDLMKWGILLPTALMKKIVQSNNRPTTVTIP